MIVTTSWISQHYTKFNNLYFDGTLPNIRFKVGRSKTSWGFASFVYDFQNNTIIPQAITISNYYDSPEDVKIQTLLHEMIHIKDYTFHPEHFIRNHRRVSNRHYDAHGQWFSEEAKRISKESGYKVANHVTHEEFVKSTISEHSKKLQENKKNNSIVCVIYGTSGTNFYFKTDINKIDKVKKTIPMYQFYKIGKIKTIKYYTFDDIRLSNMRSCCSRLVGWFGNTMEIRNRLVSIKATEIHF